MYKQGQAGVNKAIVTIVFNNEDTSSSPVGFEQCPEVTVTRQVLLGGKSKYLINGRNAPANAVQNLFHSVQLNVNNPHFLIMQGRITKVLNMKPHEILGMVEEAAGTRMYETKRVAALKTIDKKQAKVDEINAILEEEITPTLERLRGEKQNYLKWSKNSADLERLDRFCIAHQFLQAQQALQQNNEGVTEMHEQVKALEKEGQEYQIQIDDKQTEIDAMSSKLHGDMDHRHSTVKKSEQEISNQLVRITSKWKNCVEIVEKAQVDLDMAQQLVQDTKNAVSAKEESIQNEMDAAQDTIKAAVDAEYELEQLSNEYQTMSAGMSATTQDRTLPEQISQAHTDSKTAEAKIAQATLKLKHLTKELKSVEKELQKEGHSTEKLALKKEKAASKVADLRNEIGLLNFSETEFDALVVQRSELESTTSELTQQVDTLEAQLKSRLAFQYTDPVRGFDRSKVKGLVAKLVQVKETKYATALEVVAGGKLFQVVVDEAITGKALLERGKLQKRVTIIPLDKIAPRHVSNNAAQRAEQLANQAHATASPAIELVGFDEEVRTAMEYVFGSSMVVSDGKVANDICDQTKVRTVTLEGDVYDPSGTISGGSNNQLGTTLSRLLELTQVRQVLEEQKLVLDQVSTQIRNLQATSSNHEKLSAQIEIAQAELDAVEKHLSQTNFGMLVEKRNSCTTELAAAEQDVVLMTKEMNEKWQLYQSLMEQEAELTQQRELRLTDIEQAVQNAKKRATGATKLAREAESRTQTLTLELESLKAEVIAAEEAVRLAELACEEAQSDESESQIKVGEIQTQYEDARHELDMLQENIASCSAEVSGLKKEKASLMMQAESSKLQAKKLTVSIARIVKDRTAAEKAVTILLQKHAWIENDMENFGVAGGDYDFDSVNSVEVVQHLKELKEEQESLVRVIGRLDALRRIGATSFV